MAAAQKNSKSPTIRRIMREAAELANASSPDYAAEPLESDLFEWHFTLRGPPNSVYSEGIYHGRIVLPPSYPLRPPSFRFNTPNGRFEANREICLSISGHHEETWQPAWGIRTALVALRSFMETDVQGQLGGLVTTEAVRLRLARESGSYRCSMCNKSNAEIIADCEKRCKDASVPEDQVEVPEELSLAWRDELEAAQSKAPGTASGGQRTTLQSSETLSEEAELAECFVQTSQGPDAAAETSTATKLCPPPTLPPPSHTSNRASRQTMTGTLRQHERRTDTAVPVWIDRAIVALVVMLVALVMKVLFGL